MYNTCFSLRKFNITLTSLKLSSIGYLDNLQVSFISQFDSLRGSANCEGFKELSMFLFPNYNLKNFLCFF